MLFAAVALIVATGLVVPPAKPDGLYLGLDLSTQSITGVLLDSRLQPVRPATSVNFDNSFPEYGTKAGMSVGKDGVVTSPVTMWLRALDALFDELKGTGLLGRVAAVSCSGQQHGSVYWTQAGLETLSSPPASAARFADALSDAFAVTDCPIWADSSTQSECDAIEAAFSPKAGSTLGAAAVARLTGSRAYARFTGPQIAAISTRQPAAWAATERVSLVSSWGAALLTGRHQPVDTSDASGTLLMDIRTRTWAPSMLTCGVMPPELEQRLGGPPVPSHSIVGTVSPFAARASGLREGCVVAASSGDNPCAIAGLGLARAGDLALSLGTSDTLLGVAAAAAATPATEGHIMAHPTDPASIFGMLCYKNGGAARQAVRDERCEADWGLFDEALRRAPPANDGVLGLSLPLPEITPIISRNGEWYVDGTGKLVPKSSLSTPQLVRAVVEGRFLSMRARGGAIGLSGEGGRVLATGGGSQSKAILQIAADVFGAPVLASDTPDAAAIGAARRAAYALALAAAQREPHEMPYAEFLTESAGTSAEELRVVAMPLPEAAAAYDDALVARYKELEDSVAAGER
jgi:xylulokinase